MANLYHTNLDTEIDEENKIVALGNKLHNNNRKSAGFICIAIGGFIGFLSVLLCIINPIPELFNYFLYGLTLLAIGTIFSGFYLIFEN